MKAARALVLLAAGALALVACSRQTPLKKAAETHADAITDAYKPATPPSARPSGR